MPWPWRWSSERWLLGYDELDFFLGRNGLAVAREGYVAMEIWGDYVYIKFWGSTLNTGN